MRATIVSLLLPLAAFAGDLKGVVVDEAGKPLAGVEVAAFTEPWRLAGARVIGEAPRRVDGPKARTDGKGAFVLRLRTDEHVSLHARRKGRATTLVPDCHAGQTLRVVMPKAVTLRVQAPPGTRVSLSPVWAPPPRIGPRTGLADATGAVVFDDLPGNAMLYVDATHPLLGNIAPVRAVAPGTVTIELPKGWTARGTIRDEAGKPIAGARVGLGVEQEYAVRTDADGAFAFPAWSVAQKQLYATATGRAALAFVPQPGQPVELTMRAGHRVAGRLVDAAGKPVAGAYLVARGAVGFASHARSDDDGRFAFDAVPGAGATLFVFSASGRRMLDFDLPGPVDLGDVPLETPVPLRGRVLHADGRPAAGVRVAVGGADHRRKERKPKRQGSIAQLSDWVLTDLAGRFAFAGLAPGSYTVSASPLGGKTVQATVERADDLVLTLKDARTLAVEVVDGKGRPALGVSVTANTEDRWSVVGVTGADGVCRLTSDTAFLALSTDDFGKRFLSRAGIAVEGDEVVVRLERCTPVRVLVLDPDGKPLPFATIRLSALQPTRPGGFLQTDANGVIDAFFPVQGTADLELTAAPSWKGDPLQGRLRAAARKEVRFRTQIARGDRQLTVVVLDPDGRPLPGAQVYASIDGKLVKGANVVSNADGVAQLGGLPFRPVTVWAKGRGDGWMKAFADNVRATGQQIKLRIERELIVQGVVKDVDGTPAKKVSVAAQDGNSFPAFLQTDDKGRFRFALRPSQCKNLWIYAQSFNQAGERWYAELRKVPRDGSEIVLRLEPVR